MAADEWDLESALDDDHSIADWEYRDSSKLPRRPEKAKKKWGRRLVKWVAVVLTTVIPTFWAVMQASAGARNLVCPHPQVFAIPGHGIVCDDTYEPITDLEARRFIVNYYNAANRTNPKTSWSMLSSSDQQAVGSEKDYATGLDGVLWGEVAKPPAREDGSRAYKATFLTYVRRFTVDGFVSPYIFDVQVDRDQNGSIQIDGEHTAGHYAGGRRDYHPKVTFPKAVDLYKAPDVNAPITLQASDMAPANGSLRALCEVQLTNAMTGLTEWWTRTNQGWAENETTTLGDNPQGILQCSKYALNPR